MSYQIIADALESDWWLVARNTAHSNSEKAKFANTTRIKEDIDFQSKARREALPR